jgi:hypothetical protein
MFGLTFVLYLLYLLLAYYAPHRFPLAGLQSVRVFYLFAFLLQKVPAPYPSAATREKLKPVNL